MAEDPKTKVAESRLAADLTQAQEENARLATELAELRKDVAPVAEPRVYRDPYDAQNPLTFKKHPQGFHLGWVNPVYRESHRGWRGWTPVTYDGIIGKKLHEYLIDPPRKLATATDNIVRRGDAILCTLEEEMWLARQRKRVTKAAHQRAEHASDEKVTPATQKVLEGGNRVDPHSVPGSGRTMLS